jgi:2-polyprenyl-6-hydroxyphenyl methylase/3-demethylubiquinone-9 3-methyltransferase
MRQIDHRELIHERLAGSFEHLLSAYDTQRRVETLVDEFLGSARLIGKRALDVGCGAGHFSKRLTELGAQVIGCDLGPELVQQTRQFGGCEAVVADALNLSDFFETNFFDVVVSSECIEHTPQPYVAVSQMARVLKSGGFLAVSTPNLLWWPVVKVATMAKLRPFDGFENFSTWRGLRCAFENEGLDIVEERGLHLFPFQFGFHGLSTWIDGHFQGMRAAMINICLLGRKR